jgi:DNA polymerase III epsilon subunit-like protein
MEKVGINLRDQELYSIEGILDIFTIIRQLGEPFSHRPSLEKILEFLGIPFQKRCLHNAGNDAHFILRAFLMLAATSLERLELEHSLTTEVSDLKSIALDPIDFDSPTPDLKKFRMEVDVKKAESALRT